jgi:glycosyltransferase involved in cell wall biosynthesis
LRIALLGGSLEGGGAQRFGLRLAEALVAAGHEVWLISLDGTCDFDLQDYPALEGRILWLSRSDVTRGTLRKVVDTPRQGWRLLSLLRKLRVDTVLSLQERSNILNLLLPGRRRRIISIRSYPAAMLKRKAPAKRWLIKLFYGMLLNRAHHVVLNSRDSAGNFIELFKVPPQRVETIYNICDADTLRRLSMQPIAAPLRPVFTDPVVLTGGRMIPDKGHWQLLRAFRTTLRQVPNARLVIAGKGPLEARLRQLAADLGIERRVVFPGYVKNLAPLMAAATVFVLPSRREGFPNALLEAVLLGAPSIASDCHSGPRELLSTNTSTATLDEGIEKAAFGWLVPAPSGIDCPGAHEPLSVAERALAQAMTELLSDSGERARLALNASERGADFAPESIIPQWLDVLNRPMHDQAAGYRTAY